MKKSIYFVLYLAVLAGLFEFACRRLVPTRSYIDRFAFNDDASWRIRWVLNKKAGLYDPFKMDAYDPVLGWKLNPGLRIPSYYGDKGFTSNSKGLRGTREFPYERTGKPRVLVFGDSFTLGEEAGDDEVYVHLLNEMMPEAEFLNFGVRGYAHDQMLLAFREEGVKYKPDVVVLGFLGIDQDRDLVSFRSYAKPKFILKGGRLRLTNVPVPTPEQILAGEKGRIRSFDLMSNVGARLFYKLGFARFAKNRITAAILDAFIADVKKAGAVPLLVFLPANHEVDPGEKTGGEEFFDRYCEERKARCLNVRGRFVEAYERGVDFGPGHWNKNGHQIVAEELNNYLKKTGLVN